MKIAIALGSNIGDKLVHIQQAIEQLSAHCEILKKAPIYQSPPVDCPDNSPSFYNTAILVETELLPHELLKLTQLIEQQLGRPAEHGFHTPRTIDLDLLFAEQEIINTGELTLPHPRLHERTFVLKPLNDLCPEFIIPHQSKTVTELLLEQTDKDSLTLITRNW